MVNVKRTRLFAAGGVVIVASAAAAVILSVRDDRAAPAVPRFSDVYGRIEGGTSGVEAAEFEGQNVIGPAEIRIAGKPVSIPPRTPLYGGCQSFASADLGGPCFAQAGLRPDGKTVRWVLAFNTTMKFGVQAMGEPRLRTYGPVTWSGTIREVRGDNIIFEDGAVVPGADARVLCDPNQSLRAADLNGLPDQGARYVIATIDRATGRATQLACTGRS